ncbi:MULTISPECIES: translocation/assembly module TamB domain-containing protein [unclassified Desulfovibrio]|uniref:translocation/assembly module TamB domain-containing protein n=1 Tax=unclassified Desulfovibrio TaxID=2593640 RepID=UPI0013EBA314|nr:MULTISPECIES: translocation/assembly module TamB domain-containing protein [unclassified Desulfovibrio]
MAWFWRKKQPGDGAAPEAVPQPKHRRRWLRRCLFAALALVVTALAAVAGGLYWACQTEAGQAWLVKTANAALESKDGGLTLRLTRLSGSLPFDFTFGLQAADAHGVWLTAPDNRILWNWRALPGAVRIESIAARRPVLTRLPDLPPAPEPEPPSPPLTLQDVQALLGKVAGIFRKPPFWLPGVFLAATVEEARFPAALIDAKAASPTVGGAPDAGGAPATPPGAELRADAGLTVSFEAAKGATVDATAKLAGADAQEVRVAVLGLSEAKVKAKVTAHADDAGPGLAAGARVEAQLGAPALFVTGLPEDLLGSAAVLHLALDARELGDAASTPSVSLRGPNLAAGRVSLEGEGSWQAASGWSHGEIDGPLALRLAAALAPGAAEGPAPDAAAGDPLAMFRAPLRLTLSAGGALPAPDLDLRLACAELVAGGHRLEGLALAVSGKDLALPLDGAFPPARETGIDLDVAATLDGHALTTRGHFFYAAAEDAGAGEPRGLRAGVRDLILHAAGVGGEGALTALLPHGGSPALDGGLRLHVEDWAALSALAPGMALTGEASVELDLKSLAPAGADDPDASGVAPSQDARLAWRIPRLGVRESAGKEVARVQGLAGEARLSDLFRHAALACRLDLQEARASGIRLGAKLTAEGPLAGPLNAKLSTTGDVAAKLDAAWQPGEVLLRVLDARATLPASLTGSQPARLGARLERAARLRYGQGGFGVDRLDLALTPSGRLHAQGGLAPDKLDLDLSLARLELKPWSVLVPSLPSGAVDISARLNGSPARPSGRFRVGVSSLKIPGSQLAPLSLALTGGIEQARHGGILSARLELPQATLKALGGDAARVAARVPLLFGVDGIPKPDMAGQLSAQVRWDGALGPLWSLVPMADRRLNGRIALNADAGGTLAAPRVRGGVQINQGRFEDLMLGVLLTDITLRLNLDDKGAATRGGLPGSMRLNLSASDGRGGKASITGTGALNGTGLDIKASIDRLRPLRRRDVHIMLSGNATVRGSATAPDVAGEIIVNQGEVLLNNIEMGGSITTLPISTAPAPEKKAGKNAAKPAAASAPKPAAAAPQGNLHIRIIMLPRFIVEGRGLTSLWKANLLVTGPPSDPDITGSVEAVRGNFDFLGKNFALTRGLVTFAGGALSDPLLDIELTNETPDLTAHILVTGTVRKMKLRLTSDPSLPRDDILSRVLFGKSVNELGRLEALQLAGAVAQLAGFGGGGGGIFGAAKKALGVDVLRLGTSPTGGAESGDDDAGGTTLEMGKYLTDSIYMGIQQGMKPDSTAFIIEWELTPRTSMEIRTEQQNTWGGIKWNYKY